MTNVSVTASAEALESFKSKLVTELCDGCRERVLEAARKAKGE